MSPGRRTPLRLSPLEAETPRGRAALAGAEKELEASGGLDPFLSSPSGLLTSGGVTSPTTIMSRFGVPYSPEVSRVGHFPSVPLPAFGRLPEHAMRCGVGEGLISEMHLMKQRYAELKRYSALLEAKVEELERKLEGLTGEKRTRIGGLVDQVARHAIGISRARTQELNK